MTPDLNVLIAASRADHAHHRAAATWLTAAVARCTTGGNMDILPMVASGFLRLVTHPKVFLHPTPTAEAIRFLDSLLSIAGVSMPEVGREWPELKRLCLTHELADNDIPDAWIAAAIKSTGGHLVTFDKGFRRLLGRSELTVLDS
jgi:toxin-antitoxin system PIN domain toxin